MGQLVLENMEFYAYHGHYAEEQIIGGRFRVTVVIDTDLIRAEETDNLDDAVDYSLVYEHIRKEMNVKSKLLENLAARIAVAVKGISASIDKVTVTVSKLNPPVGGKMEAFHVISSR